MAYLTAVKAFVGRGFYECEEKKACLKTLETSSKAQFGTGAQLWEAQAKEAIRSSNTAQLACLRKAESVKELKEMKAHSEAGEKYTQYLTPVCTKYRECL